MCNLELFLNKTEAETISEANAKKGVKSAKEINLGAKFKIVGDSISKIDGKDANGKATQTVKEFVKFVVSQGSCETIVWDGLTAINTTLKVGSSVKLPAILIAEQLAKHLKRTFAKKTVKDDEGNDKEVDDTTKVIKVEYPKDDFIIEITPTSVRLEKA